MNRVPVIVWNPAYIEKVELDEDEVDTADLIPLVSGNTPIITVPASEDEGVAEDASEDSKEDEETEDVPQILQDVIASLEELNKEMRSIRPLLLGTLAPNSPLLSLMLMSGTPGRLWSKSTECILTLIGKRSVTGCRTRFGICSGSCRSGLTSRPVMVKI